jgi:hypothetical protein
MVDGSLAGCGVYGEKRDGMLVELREGEREGMLRWLRDAERS